MRKNAHRHLPCHQNLPEMSRSPFIGFARVAVQRNVNEHDS